MKSKRVRTMVIAALLAAVCLASCNLPTGGISSEQSPPSETQPSVGEQSVDNALTDRYAMRFGVGGGLYPSIDEGEMRIYAATRELDKLGMVWLRHPGNGIAWHEVQPTRDSWDFAKLDAVLQDNNHPWLFPTYGMVGNPYPFGGDFSRQYLQSLGDKADIMAYIQANSVDMDDPVQRADAEMYIKTLVERYKDQVRYWEIGGNEGIASSQRFGIVYYTYQWIKEVQPDAVVVVTAVGGDDDDQFYAGLAAFDDLLAQGMGDYFDVANFHYYGRVEGELEPRWEQRYDEYKAILDKYGVDKPIWVTETSTCSSNPSPVSGAGNEQLQALHVVQRLVVFAAKGAEKVFWYDFGELTPEDKFYGCNLYDSVQGPKPAYYTFQLLVEKLGFYESVDTLRSDDVRLYRFVTADGPIFVAWSEAPRTVDLGGFFGQGQVSVTHIIEDANPTPQTELVVSSAVPISPSPVFIEAVASE
jgi:hypothetical protein